MADQHYDLIIIESGPAGQKGAINAAKLGKRVAVSSSRCSLVTGFPVTSANREALIVRTLLGDTDCSLQERQRSIQGNGIRDNFISPKPRPN
jgi:hypothetical protein